MAQYLSFELKKFYNVLDKYSISIMKRRTFLFLLHVCSRKYYKKSLDHG